MAGGRPQRVHATRRINIDCMQSILGARVQCHIISAHARSGVDKKPMNGSSNSHRKYCASCRCHKNSPYELRSDSRLRTLSITHLFHGQRHTYPVLLEEHSSRQSLFLLRNRDAASCSMNKNTGIRSIDGVGALPLQPGIRWCVLIMRKVKSCIVKMSAEEAGEETCSSEKTFLLAEEVQYGYHPVCSHQIEVRFPLNRRQSPLAGLPAVLSSHTLSLILPPLSVLLGVRGPSHGHQT